MTRVGRRRLLKAGVLVGLLAGGVLAAARLVPKWFAERARRREAAAISATEGLWPPVPSSGSETARVLAPLAERADDGADVAND